LHLATHLPGFGCRVRLTRIRRHPKDKTNMSAKAFAACSFEPAVEQTVAADPQAPESLAAELQFREELWREYRLEAINAGFDIAQATAYANALSSGLGLAVSLSEMTPVGRSWFYQSSPGTVRRTIISGLTLPRRWGKSKATGRTAAMGASRLARGFRWWIMGGKS
jgi:hypothetical protein